MLLPMMEMLPFLEQRQTSTQPRGLDEEALDALPEIVINCTNMEQLLMDDGEAICPICHEDYDFGHRALQLPCEHLFCVDCGRQWLRRNPTCPVCRREVEVSNEEVQEADSVRSEESSEDWPAWTYAQGSPLAAVRRARRNQENGV